MFNLRMTAGLLLSFLFMLGVTAYADEVTPLNDVATQGMEVEKSGAIFKIQKQPTNGNTSQVMKVSKCGLCVLIQINGKIKEEK